MKIIEKKSELTENINFFKNAQKIVGLVPTMGALHEGHLSLIKQAKKETDIVVVSIFVNRKQFNNPNDFDSYPRNLNKDLKILEKENCPIVFVPTENEIFSEEQKTNLNFGILTEVLEAKYRPGHFEGVADVVRRFFEIVKPDKAFFGLKDYQQYLLIKSLCHQLSLPIEIVGCPTVRNSSGLALSSRNELLNDQEKENALILHQSLIKAKKNIKIQSTEEIKKIITKDFSNSPLKLEYFEIADSLNLEKINGHLPANRGLTGLVSAYLGKVRLIDNITLIP